MGLRALLKGGSNGDSDVVQAEKEGKTREIRMTVFPAEGGRPYIQDVEVDSQGTFELGDETEGTYKVARGSIWQEPDGKLRGLVNEANPLTISADTLSGQDVMHPSVFHAVAENNLWEQLDTINRRRGLWQSGLRWGLVVGILVVVGLQVWQIKTMGTGLEELEQAIRSLAGNLGGSGGGSGHQNIAPGGQ